MPQQPRSVPLILATAMVFLLPTTVPGLGISGAAAGALAYAGFYFYISPGPLGISASAFVGALFAAAHAFAAAWGPGAWVPALAVHVVAWVAQFVGHGVFEGRAPALLDNLFQAVFMAPIFVFIEVLMAAGLLKAFKKEATAETSKRIAKFRKAAAGR